MFVIDGDTIGIGAERLRLQGFDTPELASPRCPRERELALAAKALLIHYLRRPHTLQRTGFDHYGRTLAIVHIEGKPLAALMIESGLAKPYPLGHRPDWCGS